MTRHVWLVTAIVFVGASIYVRAQESSTQEDLKSYTEDLARINRRERLAVLQAKIDRLNKKLEDLTLSVKKRTRQQQKLEHLLKEKSRLLNQK